MKTNWNIAGSLIPILLMFFSCGMNERIYLEPVFLTSRVIGDPDDPAVWIDKDNPENSLVLGTDKVRYGRLYIYDIFGNEIRNLRIENLNRPNNVYVVYSVDLDGVPVDIAVITERGNNQIRIYRLPDLIPLDKGGLEVFRNQKYREPMGIALYKRESDGAVYAIISRKSGPSDGYLSQYSLTGDGSGNFQIAMVRSFGKFSGIKEIESIAVDDGLGYVYYSDEQYGIRKYHADPDRMDNQKELAAFGTLDFKDDSEGIAIWKTSPGKGYIIVSDQAANRLNIYPREGSVILTHHHPLLKFVPIQAVSVDGIEVAAISGEVFADGLLVSMSDSGKFHYYSWEEIAEYCSPVLK